VILNPQNGVAIQDVFWLVSPTRAFFLINSGSKVEDGTIDQQQGTAFSNSSLNGQFALVMDGFDTTSFVDRVGTLHADGNGTLTLPGFLPGNYSVASNGRVTGSISSLSNNLVFYVVSNNSAYALQNDTATQISGTISKQP